MQLEMMLLKRLNIMLRQKNIEDNIPDLTNLATKTILNTNINEVKNEIPSINNLATTSALTGVENKIRSVSSLVKKTDYDTKVKELEKKITDHNHDEYITTLEFNTLAVENFAARSGQADLVTKTDFDNKLSNLNKIIVSNKTQHLIVENEL